MEPSSGEQLYDDPDVGNKTQDPENKRQPESEQKLSKITHNALENINVIGQGLKHLFQQQRRRSSVSPHDVQQTQVDMEPETELENQNTCAEIDGVSTHSTALNRVLQQIRVPPKMKRGTSLHNRRGKSDPPKGSPQINRKSVPDINSGRPRSSSTTDAPSNLSILEMASPICLGGDDVGSVDREIELCCSYEQKAPLSLALLKITFSNFSSRSGYELVNQVTYDFSLLDEQLSNQISNFQIKVEQVHSPDKTQNTKPNEWCKQREQEFQYHRIIRIDAFILYALICSPDICKIPSEILTTSIVYGNKSVNYTVSHPIWKR